MNYLDFDLEISPGTERMYPVTARSKAGEARITMRFPFDEQTLKQYLDNLQIALQSPDNARSLSAEQQAVQDFGKSLFDALIAGEVRSRYDVSREQANQQSMGLRLKLHILAPELAALPWEFLYDARQPDFMCLSRHTPVIRYLDMPQSISPLTVKPPLRILGMIASPSNLAALDIEREKQLMRTALQDLEADGMVKLNWLAGQTWRDLMQAMWGGPWHVFHFIGHGGFDAGTGEGLIALASETGQSHLLTATQLGSLLADHGTIRLALLNACEGARGSTLDVFSSTASTLARGGIPAVLAMQYEITDDAAIEFTRTFYNALASGMSVDAAVAEARKAIRMAATNTLEWGTPILYMRSPDGVLFDLQQMFAAASQQEQPGPAPIVTPPPGDASVPSRKAPVGTASPADVPLANDRAGQQLGNYRLIRLLGQSSFTEVYLGEHIYLGTQAAIKTLLTHLDGADVEKFHKEARIIAHLDHPHLVRVLDFGIENDAPFLIMSYAPNGTLRQRHPEGTPLSLATILPYVQQVAEALQYIHNEGLIHRNVKPENMMLGRRNEVLLSDSSINVITQSILHQSKLKVIGAVAYKAPEQLQGNPRPASDQYALGVVVYEWLCGDQPFHGSVMEVYGQHLYVLPPSLRTKLPAISPVIERVVLKALAKNPDERFVSVQEFANALEQASLVEGTVIEKPQSKPPSVTPQANLHPLPSPPHVPADEPTQPASTSTPSSGQPASVPAVVGAADAARRLAPGTELARRRYKIDKVVTVGSTGAVYSAIDTRLNRLCAIKEMLDNLQSEAERRQALEWFSREARLLLNLNHPYIVRMYDFFIKGNRYYVVMDFIEGRTLSEVLEKEGNVTGLSGAHGVSQARARSWGQQLCNALSYLHCQTPPIIFRDLKPPNILVTQYDEIRLIDFGIAHTLQPQGRSTIMIIGYTPLEQLHGMPEPRSDIYALGATLHRILTHYDAANNRPSLFSYPALRTLRPDVSPAFEQIVMKALAASPEQRWSSAAEMEQAFLRLW